MALRLAFSRFGCPASLGAFRTNSVSAFVSNALEQANISCSKDDVEKLESNNIVSMSILEGLSNDDYNQMDISIGSRHAIKNAIQNEAQVSFKISRTNSFSPKDTKQRSL